MGLMQRHLVSKLRELLVDQSHVTKLLLTVRLAVYTLCLAYLSVAVVFCPMCSSCCNVDVFVIVIVVIVVIIICSFCRH